MNVVFFFFFTFYKMKTQSYVWAITTFTLLSHLLTYQVIVTVIVIVSLTII